jgi:hypothetical protein
MKAIKPQGRFRSSWLPRRDALRSGNRFQIDTPGYTLLNARYSKNISGNKLIFEENNLDLGLIYRRSWRSSDRFGFILTMWLHNHSGEPANILAAVSNRDCTRLCERPTLRVAWTLTANPA